MTCTVCSNTQVSYAVVHMCHVYDVSICQRGGVDRLPILQFRMAYVLGHASDLCLSYVYISSAFLWSLCSQCWCDALSRACNMSDSNAAMFQSPCAMSSSSRNCRESPDAEAHTGSVSTETPLTESGLEERMWSALPQPSESASPRSSESPRLSPARQRQRIDEAGVGHAAGRSLQAELVRAAMAEPVAREENAEPVMPSPQDDDEVLAESDADGDEERVSFKRIYNAFLSRYRRWVNGKVAEFEGRALQRKRAAFALWGKCYQEKEVLACAFWHERGAAQSEKARILEHWRNTEAGDSKRCFLRSNSAFLTYNGEWGVMSSIPVPATPESPEIEELEFVVKQCQKCQYVRAA